MARPDHLGDALLSLPAVAALKRALPRARITYVVSPALRDVVLRCPYVDEVRCVAFPDMATGREPEPWSDAVARASRELQGRFDAAILFRPDDPWCGRLVAEAEVPVRIGFDMPRTRPHLTDALAERRDRHVAEAALELTQAAAGRLGVDVPLGRSVPRDLLVASPQDEQEAGDAVDDPDPVLLHPSSSWRLKNWQVQRWGALAARLRERFGVTPLISDAPGEAAVVAAVVAHSHGAAA
ncbi:MAG: glycosyltransferase family 9 protein, partial [Actinomycetota bacterium]